MTVNIDSQLMWRSSIRESAARKIKLSTIGTFFRIPCRNTPTQPVIQLRRLNGPSWLPRRCTMCPFCLGTVGLVVAGVVSSGGLAALAVKVSRKTNGEQVVTNLNNNEEK
jgi:hypothetical protein